MSCTYRRLCCTEPTKDRSITFSAADYCLIKPLSGLPACMVSDSQPHYDRVRPSTLGHHYWCRLFKNSCVRRMCFLF
jgi:hypothetical protein